MRSIALAVEHARAGTDRRNDVAALGEYPGNRNLRRFGNQMLVQREVVAGEARQIGTKITLARGERSAQQASGENPIRSDASAELVEQPEDLRFRIAADQGVFTLEIGDRVDVIGAKAPNFTESSA